MATPNYSYEKRQRELAKKRKKEEKSMRKSSGTGEGAEVLAEREMPEPLPAVDAAEPADAAQAAAKPDQPAAPI